MKAEIIAIGSELLTPYRSDTNSLYLTEKLNGLGIEVRFKTIVGDDRARLADSFRVAISRVSPLIREGRRALVVQPWMGDPASKQLAEAMTEQHTVGPNSIIGVLEAYQAELQRVVDTLTQMLQNYQRADADSVPRT